MECGLECCQKNNSGMCKHCGTKETVYHFLITCTKYDTLRDYFLACVAEIYTIYDINLTLENILFPPKALSWSHRKMVLDNICKYVKDSRRIMIRTWIDTMEMLEITKRVINIQNKQESYKDR